MYRSSARPRGASDQYGQIELNARIANASPHGLVMILFEELLKSLILAQRASAPERRSESASRALSIITSLNDTLNFDAGGQIAATLSSVYSEARRLVMRGIRDNNAAHFAQAERMMAEIAQSWRSIGEVVEISS